MAHAWLTSEGRLNGLCRRGSLRLEVAAGQRLGLGRLGWVTHGLSERTKAETLTGRRRRWHLWWLSNDEKVVAATRVLGGGIMVS